MSEYKPYRFDGKDWGLPGVTFAACVGHGEISGTVHGLPDDMPRSLQIAIDDWWTGNGVYDAVERYQDAEAATRDDEEYHRTAEAGAA